MNKKKKEKKKKEKKKKGEEKKTKKTEAAAFSRIRSNRFQTERPTFVAAQSSLSRGF